MNHWHEAESLVQAAPGFPQAPANKFHNIGHDLDTKNIVTLIGVLCALLLRGLLPIACIQPVHSLGASRVEDQLEVYKACIVAAVSIPKVNFETFLST